MNLLKIVSGIILLFLFTFLVSYAEIKALPTKNELIKELLLATDSTNLIEKSFIASIDQLKISTLPNTIESTIIQQYGSKAFNEIHVDKRNEAIKRFSNKVADKIKIETQKKLNIGSIYETIWTQLYDKYFEAHEIQYLIDFYRSPTGKKSVLILPQLTTEAMKASAEATEKVVIEIYIRSATEEMTVLLDELFQDQCKNNKANSSNKQKNIK